MTIAELTALGFPVASIKGAYIAAKNTRAGFNASSTVWEDLSENNADFTLTNVSWAGSNAIADPTYANFNGTNSHMFIAYDSGNDKLYPRNGATYALWVDTAASGTIFNYYLDANNWIVIHSPAGDGLIYVDAKVAGASYVVKKSTAIGSGKHLVIITMASQAWNIYLDEDNNIDDGIGANRTSGTTQGSMMGARTDGTDDPSLKVFGFFKYDKVLTGTERANLYNAGILWIEPTVALYGTAVDNTNFATGSIKQSIDGTIIPYRIPVNRATKRRRLLYSFEEWTDEDLVGKVTATQWESGWVSTAITAEMEDDSLYTQKGKSIHLSNLPDFFKLGFSYIDLGVSNFPVSYYDPNFEFNARFFVKGADTAYWYSSTLFLSDTPTFTKTISASCYNANLQSTNGWDVAKFVKEDFTIPSASACPDLTNLRYAKLKYNNGQYITDFWLDSIVYGGEKELAAVVVTFDTFWRGVLDLAFPYMQERGIIGTNYFHWASTYDYAHDARFFSVLEGQTLKNAGWDIGAGAYIAYGWTIGGGYAAMNSGLSDMINKIKEVDLETEGIHHAYYPMGGGTDNYPNTPWDPEREFWQEAFAANNIYSARGLKHTINNRDFYLTSDNWYRLHTLIMGGTFTTSGNTSKALSERLNKIKKYGGVLFLFYHDITVNNTVGTNSNYKHFCEEMDAVVASGIQCLTHSQFYNAAMLQKKNP